MQNTPRPTKEALAFARNLVDARPKVEPLTIEGIRVFQFADAEGSPTLKEQAACTWEAGYGVWILPVPGPCEGWKEAGGDEPGVPVLPMAILSCFTEAGKVAFDEEYDKAIECIMEGDEPSVWYSTRARMTNRRMWEMLDKGECIDVGGCPRRENGDYHLWYVDADWIGKSGIDFCNARTESWIWSIGKHRETGEVWASHSGWLYQNPDYHCLRLRLR